MDRWPGMGPAMNRSAGVEKTMRAVAGLRERQMGGTDAAQGSVLDRTR